MCYQISFLPLFFFLSPRLSHSSHTTIAFCHSSATLRHLSLTT
jgi:hypothetical protein